MLQAARRYSYSLITDRVWVTVKWCKYVTGS